MADDAEAGAPAGTPANDRPPLRADPPYPQSPVLKRDEALIVLLVNLFFPGIGTIAGGILGDKPLIGRGIAQLILTIILIGWIWALITSIQTLQNAVWWGKRSPGS